MVLIMFNLSIKAQSCGQYPAYGDSLVGISTSYDTTGFNSGSTGAGVTWNYAGLVVDTTDVISHYYYNPSTTPGAGSFPDANLADLTPIGQYTYSKSTTDSVTFLGTWSDPANCPTQLFSDPQTSICPFVFGNSFSDNYKGYSCGSGMYGHNSGTRVNTFDGTGTLILPTITYNNVNRIKVIDTSVDSTFLSNGTPIGTTSSILTLYLWIDANTSQGVFLMMDLKSITYNMTFRSIIWSDYSHIPSMVTSVQSAFAEQQSVVSIYPNPFNKTATIKINENFKNKSLEFIMCNLLGSEVQRQQFTTTEKEYVIGRGNLSEGMYLYKLTGNNEIIGTGKLIIQ